MSDRPDNLAAAKATVEALRAQAGDLRAQLAELRSKLARVQRDFSESRAAQLKEANQNLVLAVLHADAIADTAVDNLGKLVRSSQYDTLTGTPSRALMLDRLRLAMATARRRGTGLAVLFIDLDQFKQFNSLLGHAGGDVALQVAAHRLQSALRESDMLGRYGGDEFLALLSGVERPPDAAAIATKMHAALAAATDAGDDALHLSASIGIAIFPQDGTDAATLIDHADAAMYRSKQRGPGHFAFHADTADDTPPATTAAGEASATTREALAQASRELRMHDLRDANQQLVIAALAAQQSADQAADAHRQQIRFMAMVAHELRNPLTPIRVAAGLIINRSPRGEVPLPRLHAIIEAQVAHMARLIDDLLDGSRISTGKLRLEREPLDLRQTLARAVQTCKPSMDARHQRFRQRLPRRSINYHGDPVRLAQIFNNLLDNASKYTPEHGEITLAVTGNADAAVISIADNGIGLARESLQTVFDLFVQHAHAETMSRGGLGIGLAIVRDLVAAHGGTIVARSEGPGLGSEFIVTLPFDGPAPTRQ
jgi:diguanylate cyclase (GGDEF)-like protein